MKLLDFIPKLSKINPIFALISALIATAIPFLVDLNVGQAALDIVLIIYNVIAFLVVQTKSEAPVLKGRSLGGPEVLSFKDLVLKYTPWVFNLGPTLKILLGIVAAAIPFLLNLDVPSLVITIITAIQAIGVGISEWIEEHNDDPLT